MSKPAKGHEIVVTIGDGGQTEVAVKGYAGKGCHALTEAIEKSLGSVTSDQKTPEYHHAAKQGQQAKAGA